MRPAWLLGERTSEAAPLISLEAESVLCLANAGTCGKSVGEKKPHAEMRFFKLVGLPGVEPGTNGLCVPLQLSLPLSGSWSGLSLAFTARPYSLYTFLEVSQGLARDYHADAEASPNLSDSTKGQS